MGSIFEFDEYELDVDNRELRRGGVPTKADGLVLRLLEVFVRSPGQLIAKHELVAQVWNGRAVSENALTVAMTRLRKALNHERGVREVVVTVHGHGYRFSPAVVARETQPSPSAGSDHGLVPNLSPFVGRERVLSELRAALAQARSGNGSAVVLTGAPGIGKTRLAEILAHDAAAANVRVAWAYCRELGDTPPLWPFAALLREAIAPLSPTAADCDPRLRALIPSLAGLLPELAHDAETAAPRREAGAASVKLGSKQRVFDAVARALALAADHAPLALILDDLDRADAASLELLHYILAEIPRSRILFLGTMRSDGSSGATPRLRRVLAHRNCARVALPPLDQAQVASYLAELFGDVDPDLCRAVFERSEGNPLFMTELARQLREFERQGERQSERPDIAALSTPLVALELVRQRVADLEEATRAALTCAAVIGRRFGLPLLQAMTGRDAADLMAQLDQAVAREVLMPARDSPTEFVFTHDLLRAALYEALTPAQRRASHARVAQALEPRVALGEAPASDLAYHAWTALPEGDLRKTVDHCIAASNAAASMYAYADAARYLKHARQALDLIENASARLRFGLLMRQAAYVRGYSAHEFRPLAEQALHLARELGTGVALAQAAMLLDSFPGFPPLPGSRRALAESLASLPEDAHHTRATLLVRIGTSAPLTDFCAESAAELAQSLELARQSPDIGQRMITRFAELYLYGGPGHDTRCATALRELQDICTEHTATFTLPPVLLDIHRALTAVQTGDLTTMNRALERAEARCREFDIELLWHVERFRALARINAGQVTVGRTALLELHHRAASVGPVAGAELFCAYDQSVVLGSGSACSGAWQRALALEPDDPPNIWAMKVRALAAAGWHGEARTMLSAVPAQGLKRLTCDREYLGTLGALAKAALILQASDYARVLHELLSPYPEHFAVNVAFVCEGPVSQLLDALARQS